MDIVKIKRIDEVYIKVIADPHVLMELSDKFTFMVPGAQFSPKFKNKVWDGKIRMINSFTGLIYAGLREEVEKYCTESGYQVEHVSDFAATEFSVVEAKEFISRLNLPESIELRDYQIDALVKGVRDNRVLFLSPTGSGKSLIMYFLIRYFGLSTLIVVPGTGLNGQLTKEFNYFGLDTDRFVHTISAGKDKSVKKPITISTYQSLAKMPKEFFDRFDLVIVDEAHGADSKSITTIMKNLTNCKYRFGLTGTLNGTLTHELVLKGLFGPVHKTSTTTELIEAGYLTKFKIKAIVLKYPAEVRKLLHKASYDDEISYIVQNEARNNFIANLAASLKGNTLVLFRYVDKQGIKLYNQIVMANPDRKVYFIDGSVKGDKRNIIRENVEEEENVIIVASSGTTSTGVNIKNLDNLIFASPYKGRIKNLQSIGRVLRTASGKELSTLFDIADDLTHKSRQNHTLGHFMSRVVIYNEEQFPYKIYNVSLNI